MSFHRNFSLFGCLNLANESGTTHKPFRYSLNSLQVVEMLFASQSTYTTTYTIFQIAQVTYVKNFKVF
ncbi:MAG: hypothetical protein LBT05_04130 [Planctomycetaceae bacterium]|nr:hypothetical protein [Planctomycetaceae bacterium]